MTCERCEGLMVQDNLLDLDDLGAGPWVQAWRCINCGAIVEDRIRLNRLAGEPQAFGGRPSLSTRSKTDGKRRAAIVHNQKEPCHR